MPDTLMKAGLMKAGPKLADRTGPCGAVRCDCGGYQPGPPSGDTTWQPCACRHSRHIHAPQQGNR